MNLKETVGIKVMAITADIETIYPDIAVKMMGMNKKNRPLRNAEVQKYKSKIERGEWDLNGEAIKISKTGVILDGQHRISAVIEAGRPITTLVVRGLEDAVFDSLDRGARRSLSDIFSIKGEKNVTVLASAVTKLYIFKVTGDIKKVSPGNEPSEKQLELFLEDNPRIRDSVSRSNKAWMTRYLGPSSAAFCYHLMSENYPAETERFFEVASSGVGLENEKSAGTLAKRLHKAKEDAKITKASDSMSPRYKCALTIKAFKHFLSGKNISESALRIREKGSGEEKGIFKVFPK